MIATMQRVQNYSKQSGKKTLLWAEDLTPKRRRRIHQKTRALLVTGGKVHRKPRSGERSAFLQDATPIFTPQSRPDVHAALESVDTGETWGDFGPVPEPAVITDAVFDERTPDVEPLADWEIELLNLCPRCKATGDDSCVTPSGKATKTHKGRGE